MLSELFVKITSDFSGLDKGIKESQEAVQDFADNVSTIGTEAFGPMQESIAGVGENVAIVTTDLGGLGNSLTDTQTKTMTFSGGLKQISADFDTLKAKYEQQQEGLIKLGEGMANVGGKMTMFVTLPLLGAAAASFKLASDMVETTNKINVAFGDSSSAVMAWSETSLEAMGMAQASALDAAALFGDMATSMGFAQDKAADMSINLTQLGADLSSFKNVPIEQAMSALNGVFTGETESLKMLGVVMTETSLEAFALSKGIQKNVGDMTQAEKIQLRYAFVMENTKNSQGDWSRNTETAAASMKTFKESLKELGVQIGTIILPFVNSMIQKINGLIEGFINLPTGVKKVIIGFGAFLAVLGPILLVGGKILMWLPMLKAGIVMVLPAIKVLGIALKGLAMNPMGLIILAIGAVIAAAIYLWQNWDTVKIQLMRIVNAISYGFQQGLSYLKTLIFKYVDMYLAAFEKLLGWVPGIGNAISKAREKMSDLIDEEKLKRETNTFNFQTTEAGLSAELAAQKMEDAKKKTGELGDEISNTTDQTFEYNDGLDDLKNSLTDTTDETKKAKDTEKDYKNTVKDTTKGLNELTDAQKAAEEARRGMYDKTEKGLNKLGDALITALKKRYDEQEKIELDILENKKNNETNALKESLKNLKTNYDKQVKALKDKAKQEIKVLTDAQKSKLAIIDAETLDQVNALQRQIDAINDLTDKEDKQLEEQAYNTRIAELHKEWYAADSAEERTKINQKINEEIAKRQRELLLEERKMQIEALKTQIENIKDNADQRKEEIEKQTEAEVTAIETRLENESLGLEESFEKQQSALEEKLQIVEQFYEDLISTTKQKYEKLTTQEALFEEARLLALAENQNEMLKLLEKYNPKWQDAGQSFGNSLLEGLNSTKQNIKSAIKSIFDMMNFMENERQYLTGLVEKGKKENNPGLIKWAQQQAELLGIPKLAKGGIVKMPTLAMIGEKGAEAVIPLNRMNDFMGQQPINVYLDGRKITGTIAPQMVDMIRGRIGSAY
jgi:energy-converting hydrogenase Eha subunit C